MHMLRPNSPLSILGRSILARMIASALIAIVVSVGPASTQTNTVHGAVRYVTDGDTFTLRGVERSIRVWGLDAPERDERGGSAATRTMRQLITGQNLTCRVRDIDRYGRIVGQCFLPDGRDIAAQMIAAGVATEYCYFSGGFYGTCRGN